MHHDDIGNDEDDDDDNGAHGAHGGAPSVTEWWEKLQHRDRGMR